MTGLTLTVRDSIDSRVQYFFGTQITYLSIFSWEVDYRFDALSSEVTSPVLSGLAVGLLEVRALARELELTDALIVERADGVCHVIRGGASNFPLYYSSDAGRLQISTHLPISGSSALSREGLLEALASSSMPGCYELNGLTQTPLRGWQRIKRGCITTFERGEKVREQVIDYSEGLMLNDLSFDHVAKDLVSAFDRYGSLQSHSLPSSVELSGGIDSTISISAAQVDNRSVTGISVEFPYYEFRYEAEVQRETAKDLGIRREVVDGVCVLPYSPWSKPPVFDEPNLFITGMRHAEEVVRTSAHYGSKVLYIGHGGDQLFSTDLTELEPFSRRPCKGPFSNQVFAFVNGKSAELEHATYRHRTSGCFVYDGRQDVWAKELFGVTPRTPFTDLAVFKSAIKWSKHTAALGIKPNKTILTQSLRNRFPTAVIERKGKVAYDGVWMRGYENNLDWIIHTIEMSSEILEHLGLSVKWLSGRARDLSARKTLCDDELISAFSLSSWLNSWNITDKKCIV